MALHNRYGQTMDAPGWRNELKTLNPQDWAAFLSEHSGLPGPRANLSLVSAAASAASPDVIDALVADDGEYTVMCAAAALGRGAQDPIFESRARQHAADARWRVREGVALGIQLLGDDSPEDLIRITSEWADDPDPLVQRAAVASICEPRLLRSAQTAAAALALCATVTARFSGLAADRRRQPDARYLRQALGYCWSIAVAASPGEGLAAFRALDVSDPDVAWVVKQNSGKKRLAALL